MKGGYIHTKSKNKNKNRSRSRSRSTIYRKGKGKIISHNMKTKKTRRKTSKKR